MKTGLATMLACLGLAAPAVAGGLTAADNHAIDVKTAQNCARSGYTVFLSSSAPKGLGKGLWAWYRDVDLVPLRGRTLHYDVQGLIVSGKSPEVQHGC